jgi:hypothetical protein
MMTEKKAEKKVEKLTDAQIREIHSKGLRVAKEQLPDPKSREPGLEK